MKFLLNFQTQKTTQEENNCRKLFVISSGNLHSCMTQSHAVISVIHEKVYIKVQRELSKKKLDSLTGVAAVHKSQRPKLLDEIDEVYFYADLVATR